MRCPECLSENIRHLEFETICSDCGFVIDDEFIEPPYVPENERERIKSSLKNTAGTGAINGKIFKNSWFEDYSEKAIEEYYSKIKQMGDKLYLPAFIQKDAMSLVQNLVQIDKIKGRKAEEILASCLYASALRNNQPRTHLEFEIKTGINRYRLLSTYKKVVDELNLKFQRQEVPELIEIFCNRLKLPPIISMNAIGIWEKIKEIPSIQAKNSYVIASTLIYKASSISQREIAFVTGVHEPSIRRILKLI